MASWWGRGAQPRAANQSAKRAGRSDEGAATSMAARIARLRPPSGAGAQVQAVVEAPSRKTDPTRGLSTLKALTVIGFFIT